MIKQCVVSEDTMHILSFHLNIPLLLIAEVEKTGMIGALPVLVPGCREVCPSSVWYLGDIRRGSAVHTSFISIKCNIVSLSVFPILLIISFLLSFLSFFPSPSLTPPTSPSIRILTCRCRAPGRTASAGRQAGRQQVQSQRSLKP